MEGLKLFTSESVTEGHPDKLCDLIADNVLDVALSEDPFSRVACEVCATTGLILVIGEITTNNYIDISNIARNTVLQIGYDNSTLGLDGNTCAVLVCIDEQSKDIKRIVDKSIDYKLKKVEKNKLGAGDQGIMFGYACKETNNYMPITITLAHELTRTLAQKRKNNELPYLLPDGKSQVTIAFENGIPKYVDTIIISTQHKEEKNLEELRIEVENKIIKKIIPTNYWSEKTKVFVNPAGKFCIGGPHGDSGLTGRKIIVDTYGGVCRHGGGSFSGKDPTKVDRSAAYYARYVAKNLVAADICDKISIQVSYIIGKASPISLSLDVGKSNYSYSKIMKAIEKVFDFRIASIIEKLDLNNVKYSLTTNYGHFGKEYLSWEKIDKVEELQKVIHDC